MPYVAPWDLYDLIFEIAFLEVNLMFVFAMFVFAMIH